jgi:RHS repeat-associated protein
LPCGPFWDYDAVEGATGFCALPSEGCYEEANQTQFIHSFIHIVLIIALAIPALPVSAAPPTTNPSKPISALVPSVPTARSAKGSVQSPLAPVQSASRALLAAPASSLPPFGCSGTHCIFYALADSDDAGIDPRFGNCLYSTSENEIYLGQCVNGDGVTSGWRFPNVAIPQGTTIANAYLEFTVDGPYTDELHVRFFGEASADADPFASGNEPADRLLTSASATWDIPSSDEWQLGQIRNSPALTALVQEIVDQSGWQAGNALAIIVKNDAPASGVNLHRRVIGFARERNANLVSARLVIDLSEEAGPILDDDGTHSGDGGPKTGSGDSRECPVTSCNQTQGEAGDPVNTRTGEFSFSVGDIAIPTSAGPLVFQRSYASLTTNLYTAPLGFGWTHNQDTRLIFDGDPGGQPGKVTFKAHSANLYRFADNGDGAFTPLPGVLAALDFNGSTYRLTNSAQAEYTFNASGKLLTWADPQGRALTYTYDTNGNLTHVADSEDAHYLDFAYDAQGRLTTVSDHTSRSVSFNYDASGDLTSVVDVLGQTWTYIYDADHRLTEMTDPRGVTTRTEYDAQGRAVRQFDGLNNKIVELTFNGNGTTTVVDARDNTTTHTYGNRHTLNNQTDPLGGDAEKAYDLNFRPASMTDADGDTTSLIWSANGANLLHMVDAQGQQTDLTYDELNNLTSVTDPRGFQTNYTYDGTLLTEVSDALGQTTSYTYTPQGFLASVTDANGETTSYSYNAFGQRTSMTDALGHTTTYAYDSLGRLTDTTDPLGRITHHEYDAAGRLVRVTRNYDTGRPQNDEGQYNIVTEYQYDAVGNQTRVTDTFGRATDYQYNANNRLTAMTDPAGNTTTYAYDAAGNRVSATDPLGRTTTYVYDELNRLTSTTDPLGNTTTTTYNADGTVASTTDALGRVTGYTYDDVKRVTAMTDALDNTSFTTYDSNGNVAFTTDPLGRVTGYEYDALNRLTRQTAPDGGLTQYVYDPVGNRTRMIDPRGDATDYGYDALNRLVAVTDALGHTTTFAYDTLGNRLAATDANGHTTTFNYDALNRLASTTDPLGNTATTAYDALSRVATRTDPNNNTTAFVYDLLNRLTQQTDPLGGQMSYTYDAVGNRLTATDPNSHTTTTAYDALNRPISMTDANGNTTTTTYNAVGNVTATTDGLGHTTTFSYDALNRQTSVADPLGNVTQYDYDEVGNRISMTDAEGVVTRYEYDSRNRLSAVVENYLPPQAPDAQTNVRTEYSYDLNGNRTQIADGLSHLTTFTYDALNRLTSETDALGHTTTYAYDPVGLRQSLTDANSQITNYQYDAANRLTTIDYPIGTPDVTFAYDPGGRRTTMSDGVGGTSWAYDALNRPTTITDPFGGSVTYGYDAASNRTSLQYPDGKAVTYAYDPANRLTTVTPVGSGQWSVGSITYTYDAANRLLTAQLPNNLTTNFAYDNANRLTTLSHQTPTLTLTQYSYSYDNVGNRAQAVESLLQPASGPATPFDLYLHGSGGTANPPTLFLDQTAPTSATTKYKDSTSVNFSGGNPWKEVGTWAAAPAQTSGELTALNDLHVWLGLKNSDDQGTRFDLRAEVYRNGVLLTSGETYCIQNLTRNANQAKEVTTALAAFNPATMNGTSDTLSLKVLTRIGTNGSGAFCGGHSNAVGIRLYFDSTTRPARFGATTGGSAIVNTTIAYAYDPLYRLTAADYSDGKLFHYTYDSVGNRLTQQTQAGTTTYTYDSANRLATVNGISYIFDANGNLLDDGTSTYAYDAANRLTSVTGTNTSTYEYNGLGDRLRQTVNSVTTNYTLDLNTGLTQVLADGSNSYLYGLGRIGELQLTGFAYHLGDALGSVRQLTNEVGVVTLARSYEPFGSTLTSVGVADTVFQFTGEQRDSATGLTHLRARYLSTSLGAFTQKDPIRLERNLYRYALSNPINYVDPFGLFTTCIGPNCGDEITQAISAIQAEFPTVTIDRDPDDNTSPIHMVAYTCGASYWTLHSLDVVLRAMRLLNKFSPQVVQDLGGVIFNMEERYDTSHNVFTDQHDVHLRVEPFHYIYLGYPYFPKPGGIGLHVILHELFHVYANNKSGILTSFADAAGWTARIESGGRIRPAFTYGSISTLANDPGLQIVCWIIGLTLDQCISNLSFLKITEEERGTTFFFFSRFRIYIPEGTVGLYVSTSIGEDFAESAAQYIERSLLFVDADAAAAFRYRYNDLSALPSSADRDRWFKTLFGGRDSSWFGAP